MIKMKKWMEQFRVEDWVVVWVSIPLLALAAVAPSALPKVPATLLGGAAWSNIAWDMISDPGRMDYMPYLMSNS